MSCQELSRSLSDNFIILLCRSHKQALRCVAVTITIIIMFSSAFGNMI